MLRWTWTLVEHARPHELSRARSQRDSGESSGSGASVSAAAESCTCRLSIRSFGMCAVRACHTVSLTRCSSHTEGGFGVRR